MELEVLKNCPLFQGVGEDNLTAMLSCLNARTARYERGQIIFLEGEPANCVGIVLQGEVQILREDYEGSRNVLGVAGSGQLFGEVFACAGVARLPVSVIAGGDSRVILVDCKRIIQTCESSCEFHTRVIHNLLRIVAEKNLMLNQKIEFMARKTTQEKLMTYLCAQAKAQGSDQFTIPFDRQALADYLGVERSAMSAELSKLRKAGKIDYHRSHFRIL